MQREENKGKRNRRRNPRSGREWARVYDTVIEMVPYSHLLFMNHGYSARPSGEDFDWLRPEDAGSLQKYSMRMVRYLVEGTDLRGKKVLDVGCGRGGSCSYILRYHGPAEAWGVDFCEGQIAFCERHHRLQGLTFRHGDAQNLPLPDESFDLILNVESSHCYDDLGHFFGEAYRVAKPGSLFCYADCFEDGKQEKAEALLGQTDFTIEQRQDITQNVAWAVQLGATDLARLFWSARDSSLGNERLLEMLTDDINKGMLEAYSSRQTLYIAWRLRKV
jgi:O-methyltransferase